MHETSTIDTRRLADYPTIFDLRSVLELTSSHCNVQIKRLPLFLLQIAATSIMMLPGMLSLNLMTTDHVLSTRKRGWEGEAGLAGALGGWLGARRAKKRRPRLGRGAQQHLGGAKLPDHIRRIRICTHASPIHGDTIASSCERNWSARGHIHSERVGSAQQGCACHEREAGVYLIQSKRQWPQRPVTIS